MTDTEVSIDPSILWNDGCASGVIPNIESLS
jgi:hypothetical protein